MIRNAQRLLYSALILLFVTGTTWVTMVPTAHASPSPKPSFKISRLQKSGFPTPPALRRAIVRTLAQDWSQQAELTASDGQPNDSFGTSLALSADGHTAIVGAPWVFYGSGAVYVFTESSGAWTVAAEICCGFGGDQFGSAVAISADGKTALVGSPGYTTYLYEEQGAVYVYSGGNWTGWTARLEANDPAIYNFFGDSVALSADGTKALIGADGRNTNTGAAYVFTGSGSYWSQQAELTATDGQPNDHFGISLALSPDGTTALVDAPYRDSNTGASYVFHDNGGTWLQTAELTASDGMAGDYFGGSSALSADGTTAILGAGGHDSNAGAAYVFNGNGGIWTQQSEIADPVVGSNIFGGSVALSSNGVTALLSAPGTINGRGSAYIFIHSGGTWTQKAVLTASDGTNNNYFGNFVALSADDTTALVGAYGRNSFTGATYVFKNSNVPDVTGLTDVTVGEDADSLESFYLDGPTPITYTLASSDGTVIPPSAITVSPTDCGSDTLHLACQLTFTAAAAAGTAGVKIGVTDVNGAQASEQFTVTVAAPPTFAGLTPVTVAASTDGQATFTLTGTGALSLTASSSNTKLLPNANITGASSCSTAGSCALTLEPVADQAGSAVVTLQAADSYGQSGSGSFTFTANPPAPPTVSGLNNLTVTTPASAMEDFSLGGTGTLKVTLKSSNTTVLPEANMTGFHSCTKAGNCALTLTPGTGQTGDATVTVQVSDTYGQSSSGSFTYTVKSMSGGNGGSSSNGSGNSGGGASAPIGLLLLAGLLALMRKRE